jgi:oligopeptidase B
LEFNDDNSDNPAAHSVKYIASGNGAFKTSTIIVGYQSLVTPLQHVVMDLSKAEQRTILRELPVPGYDKNLYGCQRVRVLSRDGVTYIPVSLVYRQTTLEQAETLGTHVPIHLYAYGAYGIPVDDEFSSTRLPLLDRGVIYAIAHVRGGGALGRPWYEDGKLLHKKHTFDDFVDVARHYMEDGKDWTNPDLLSCEGRSAGGLTMGASINQAPELFRAAILGVPFVDLIATMTDASIPLTAVEWEIWGNPNEETYFEYILSYSPVNNVVKKTYPSMLLLAGLFDPRVAYWEPAKLAATLRHVAVSDPDRPVCLKTDMTSGHFSASDRYKHLEAKAFEYAFLLDQLGVS